MGDNYVKNIKKNPHGGKGGGISGLGIQGGSIPAEFRQTMKHNSSNHSISGKKFIGTIKKPVEAGSLGPAKKNYMSPYSQKLMAKN